jgi:hypothetical protein
MTQELLRTKILEKQKQPMLTGIGCFEGFKIVANTIAVSPVF